MSESLQDRYGPDSICFGCGPANANGLRIKSRLAPDNPDETICDWTPEKHHEAFEGFLSGGIIGTLLDCHCNWTAAHYLMKKAGAAEVPFTVTAEYTIKMRKPTPTNGPVQMRARVVESGDDRAVVEGTLSAGGTVTATCRGTFVAVKPGHPAYERWKAESRRPETGGRRAGTGANMRARAILMAVTLVIVVGALRAQTPAAAPDQRAFDDFRAFYRQAVGRTGIVGSSVRIVHDGRVVFSDSVGSAKLDEPRAVDEDTIFHWASITKTFTGIAVMQLRDRGRLELDDPIVKYLPELREVHNPFGPMEAITIRHLLSHSAGFRSATWPWGGGQPWHPHEPLHWEQLVAMFPYTEILFPPGSKYSYSNPGIVFLGRVIELLTTDDWEVYVDKNILKPLEMYRAYFDTTPYFLLKHRSASYWLRKGHIEPARFDHNTGITVSNGGLNAPLGDMVKYLNFLMGAPRDAALQARYDEVLKRSSLEEMWKPVVPVPAEGPQAAGAMGLTFFLEEHGGLPFVAHSGNQNAFTSHFYMHLSSRTAYVVAFNTYGDPAEPDGKGDTRRLDQEIRDYLVSRVFPFWTRPQ